MNRSALILLVEDDQSMLDGMHDLFQVPSLLETVGIKYDIEVITASNGQEALETISSQIPDLIVSDIMMPVMDGYQFLKNVQQNPDLLHIPFIFLTAKGHKKDILEGQLRGANLYITKPFVSHELLELIKIQLDKTFQRQLSHQQNVTELKKGILQILNHEFRTPLTYVTAYYEMLADSVERFSDSHNFQEYLRGIQAGCLRLTNLIDDFILVIELRTGEYQSKFSQSAKPINTINTLIERAIEGSEDLVTQKGIQINFSSNGDLPPVYGSEQDLLDVFERLLSNSIKFTPDKSEQIINISSSVQGDEVYISFNDKGTGFPKHIQNQIFDLFFQYNRGLLEQQGAGIGLTIVKEIIELHNGRIEVESQEDKGSTFTIALPIYTSLPDQSSPTPGRTQHRKRATVLIVEDEYSLLLGLKELLDISEGKYHLDVLTASNGQEGLQVLVEHQPDLIVSDIMMPIIDGYGFLKNVRQNPDWAQIPFIFLTAKGEHQDIHRGLRSGVEVYITKPYDSDELIQLISAQLDHYFLLQGMMVQNFDALKRSILNLITPDFRLPLSAVQEYSKTLSAGLTDVQNDTELKESLHGIQDGSIRLMHLVEDFISLAELKTGETETAYALREQLITNPGHLFCEMSREYWAVAEAAGIRIHCEFSKNLPSIYGDFTTLLDGLRRFVDICIRACVGSMDQDIFLSAVLEENEVCYSIELPSQLKADYLENILAITKDTDAELSSMPDYAPSLSIARSYIELNNGRIKILHKPNQTYNIIISLPVYKAS